MTHSSARPTNPPPSAQDKKYLPEQGDIQFIPFTCTKIKQVTIAIAKIHSTIQKIRLKIRKNFFISILQHKRQRIAADQLRALLGNIPPKIRLMRQKTCIFSQLMLLQIRNKTAPPVLFLYVRLSVGLRPRLTQNVGHQLSWLERLLCKQEVKSSSLLCSTIKEFLRTAAWRVFYYLGAFIKLKL